MVLTLSSSTEELERISFLSVPWNDNIQIVSSVVKVETGDDKNSDPAQAGVKLWLQSVLALGHPIFLLVITWSNNYYDNNGGI